MRGGAAAAAQQDRLAYSTPPRHDTSAGNRERLATWSFCCVVRKRRRPAAWRAKLSTRLGTLLWIHGCAVRLKSIQSRNATPLPA